MKIQVTVDQNGYVTNYGVVNYIQDENGNDICTFVLPDAIFIELKEDLKTFDEKSRAYHIVDGELIFDELKAKEIYEVEEPVNTMTIEDLNRILQTLLNE